MSAKRIRYGQLDRYLTALGYAASPAPGHVVYRKGGPTLPIILPRAARSAEVPRSHLAAVERILALDGMTTAGKIAATPNRKPAATRPKPTKPGSDSPESAEARPAPRPSTPRRKAAKA